MENEFVLNKHAIREDCLFIQKNWPWAINCRTIISTRTAINFNKGTIYFPYKLVILIATIWKSRLNLRSRSSTLFSLHCHE